MNYEFLKLLKNSPSFNERFLRTFSGKDFDFFNIERETKKPNG